MGAPTSVVLSSRVSVGLVSRFFNSAIVEILFVAIEVIKRSSLIERSVKEYYEILLVESLKLLVAAGLKGYMKTH